MVSAKDLSHLLSEEAKIRQDSPLKGAMKYRTEGMRSLGGGLPVPALFPFDHLTVTSPAVPFDQGVELTSYDGVDTLQIEVDRKARKSEDIELATSLQYGTSLGDPHLRQLVKEHTARVHNVPYEDWDVLMSIGNTFSWDAVLRTFVNRGDPILVEEFAFTSALETARADGAVAVSVKMDLEGIIPEALEKQMAQWVGPRPKLLYTVPTGQNPTGSSLSRERRKAIYDIACKYDFLIIEDEPYYYLQFPKYEQPQPGKEHKSGLSESNDALIKSLVPSFLDFDTESRVLRLDSFSKVIAPGIRLSWIVGQSRLIERLLRLAECSVQNACGFATSIVYGLLKRWGPEGYLHWLNKLSANYSHSRDVACDAILDYFPKGRYDFEPPVAGMFFWIKIDSRRCRGYKENGGDPAKCEEALFKLGLERKVMLVPGHWFISKSNTNPPQPEVGNTDDEKYALYFRGTFAGVSHDVMKSALAEFGKLLHEQLLDEIQE